MTRNENKIRYNISMPTFDDECASVYVERTVNSKHCELWIGIAEHNGLGQADSARRAIANAHDAIRTARKHSFGK